MLKVLKAVGLFVAAFAGMVLFFAAGIIGSFRNPKPRLGEVK